MTPDRDQAFARLGQRPRFAPVARAALGAENPPSLASLASALAAIL